VSHAGPVARAAELAALGHRGSLSPAELAALTAAMSDEDPRVRVAALGALARAARGEADALWYRAVTDPAAAVRRRAAELAPGLGSADVAARCGALLTLLDDRDVTVVEAAAWATGELGDVAIGHGAIDALTRVVHGHRDALAREAAVAALGALGDPVALATILSACRDKPAVRRRAVLALAPFDGPEVEAAIDAALTDRDWQVRQAAEDLRGA
jgi:HEAT repeat protein